MASEKETSGRISYRVSLIVAIPLLVVVIGALIAFYAYRNTRQSILILADSIFSQAADQTVEEARAHVGEAIPAVDLLSDLFGGDDDMLDTRHVAARLIQVLNSNPGFVWVDFADPQGDFVGAHLQAGRLIVNHSAVLKDTAPQDEFVVQPDKSWSLLSHKDDNHFDTRVRPYYLGAVAAKRRTWTDPYFFFHGGVAGISCSAPVYGEQGNLKGVVSVDFDLNTLSHFVAGLHVSEHAEVFVYDSQGRILAHPNPAVVDKINESGKASFATRENVNNDVLLAYFRSPAGAKTFTCHGETYFSATRQFQPDQGLSWNVGVVAPESDFMAGVDRTTRFSLIATAGALLLSLLLAASLAERIAAPLTHLTSEMNKVGRFELTDNAGRDSTFTEIALMYQALDAMKGGLRSFASYVPRDLVTALLASGQAAALGGKSKVMTVFFSDIADFTTLAEKIEAGQLVDELSDYFSTVTEAINLHQGTIDKFIGDAVMAFWNAPADDPQHAPRACRAALEVLRGLDTMRVLKPALGLLVTRIGLATGEVIVGNIGTAQRMNYTVMGDAANLASRLEGLNKLYHTSILVSEKTFEQSCAQIIMRLVDVVAVKGKTRGIRVYEPLSTVEENNADDQARAELSQQDLGAYLERRFEDAIALYERMLVIQSPDFASELLRDRCRQLQHSPPPAEWTGVVRIAEK